ncbi:hypothetical protein QFC20_000406 [Naganishia adeliensis]|uniref:Uncharacterized protein n=1 Tax=Naganishia adeliensis TaxID=92952 RepID=A0ACC2X0S9_9TREE|nr:hypothetical protein QFC20_000406 [Naganishia adeliensis]
MSRLPNLSVPFDLRQTHVRVSREKVVDQFLGDIRAMAIVKALELYPGKDVFIDNGPEGRRLGVARHHDDAQGFVAKRRVRGKNELLIGETATQLGKGLRKVRGDGTHLRRTGRH